MITYLLLLCTCMLSVMSEAPSRSQTPGLSQDMDNESFSPNLSRGKKNTDELHVVTLEFTNNLQTKLNYRLSNYFKLIYRINSIKITIAHVSSC